MPGLSFSQRRVFAALSFAFLCGPSTAAEPDDGFRKTVAPVIDEFCVRCHSGPEAKGKIDFDRKTLEGDRELWLKSLQMLRAGMMPPKGKPRPTAEQVASVEAWVKGTAFGIDPKNPDPGRVTVRRLNRVEYRNTIKDLLGVDFNADAAFPPDDTGHGFDNNGDVLTLSPIHLEKFIAAAQSIVGQAVPTAPLVPAEARLPGRLFAADAKGPAEGPLTLPYYKAAKANYTHKVSHAGKYQLVADLSANETYVDGQFDLNKCRLVFKADGKVIHDATYTRQGGKQYRYEFDADWKAGDHDLTFELEPLTKERQVRSLTLRVQSVTVRGPLEKDHWVKPANHDRFFPGTVPADAEKRREYTRGLLKSFAAKAYRRPVDDATVDRLVALAKGHAAGRTFEAGVAQAMTVVLASPRFLFREEEVLSAPSAGAHPLLDEFSLASRLSYFLWSSMPDAELFRLAGEGKLRANLAAQVKRMLADPRSGEFVKHFVGQWLMARAVDAVQVNAFAVISRDDVPDPKAQQQRARFRELNRKPPEQLTDDEKKELDKLRTSFAGGFRRFAQFELNGDLRRAMKRETELCFDHVLRNDRSLLELLDADYTFLNERLAKHYGVPNVTGDQMRLVKLPADSPRGGVLTQGTVLTVTSNPDRTSPVKRGLFILDNLLGTPPPPPPPDIPALEEATAGGTKPTTLRDALKLHRADPVCSSCHNRMDPLGLALENFNALGMWREKERGQAVDAAGHLITGEPFADVRELKRVLATERKTDFYRCLTEKLLVYALGRGLEYYDVQAVDEIVAALEKSGGKPSALLTGVIESAPFQKRRAGGRPEK